MSSTWSQNVPLVNTKTFNQGILGLIGLISSSAGDKNQDALDRKSLYDLQLKIRFQSLFCFVFHFFFLAMSLTEKLIMRITPY